MNPPERSATPPPRRISWRETLQHAPLPPIPADFAARLQAQVLPSPAPTRGETLLTQLLLAVLLIAGLGFALPGVVAGFAALLQQFGKLLPAAAATVCALAAAWAVDRVAGRVVTPQR